MRIPSGVAAWKCQAQHHGQSGTYQACALAVPLPWQAWQAWSWHTTRASPSGCRHFFPSAGGAPTPTLSPQSGWCPLAPCKSHRVHVKDAGLGLCQELQNPALQCGDLGSCSPRYPVQMCGSHISEPSGMLSRCIPSPQYMARLLSPSLQRLGLMTLRHPKFGAPPWICVSQSAVPRSASHHLGAC